MSVEQIKPGTTSNDEFYHGYSSLSICPMSENEKAIQSNDGNFYFEGAEHDQIDHDRPYLKLNISGRIKTVELVASLRLLVAEIMASKDRFDIDDEAPF